MTRPTTGWHASLDAMWAGYRRRKRKLNMTIEEMQSIVSTTTVVVTVLPEGLPADYITPHIDPDSPYHTGRRCK